MQKRRLGKSGIVVSEICMGTMTFGTQSDKKESWGIMDRAWEAGIDFFDTAEIYPVPPSGELAGLTEEWLGEWMRDKPREGVIIASKIAGAAHGWFNPPVRHHKAALDRVHIRRAIEGSLKRLGTDYIDLYQIHWPDHGMRVLDTLGVFEELIGEGKIRALGLSNDTPYGVMKALWSADVEGLQPIDTIQNNYSINNRRFEDELADVCRRESVSLLPYAPLAGGVLTGKYQQERWPKGARYSDYKAVGPRQEEMAKRYVNDATVATVERLEVIALEAGMDVATLAVAWSKQNDFVASTIIGASKVEQLEVSLKAAGVILSDEVMGAIDRVSAEIPYPMG